MRRRHLLLALPGLAACQPTGNQSTGTQPQAPLPVVFFTEDSAALGDEARALIAEAAERARANPRLPVAVLGFAAPAGSAGFNQAISDARARNVADALIEQGVAASRISIRPRGPVPFELIPTEARRVEIHIGG